MICRDMEERLNDYADGSLGKEAALEVEAHAAGCPGCLAEIEKIRSLLAGLAAVPRSIEPARDLWAGTAAEIRRLASDSREEGSGAATAARFPSSRPDDLKPPPAARPRAALSWLASRPILAAALLVLISGAAVLLVARALPGSPGGSPPGPAGGPAPAASVSPAATGRGIEAGVGIPSDVAAAEAEYERATQRLLQVLESRRNDLPAKTLADIDQNLRIIDGAIAETRAALLRDPSSTRLMHLVTATYRTKLDLLREAARIPASNS